MMNARCTSRSCYASCRRGAMMPLVAILLPVLIIMLGFSVDLAFMQNTRVELRAATDAAARAGAIELSRTEKPGRARSAALRMAKRNTVAGKKLVLKSQDVEIGRSERNKKGEWVFTKGAKPWNSVQVRGDRTKSSAGGAVDLFFNAAYGGQDFEPEFTSVSTFLNVDICLVLDRSGSMDGQKIKDLQNAVDTFLYELEQTQADEQVGLASYSTSARIDHNLTESYGPIRNKVEDFKADGWTAIGLALGKGIDAVMGTGHRKLSTPLIILMTDGNHNTDIDPVDVAATATRRGITVHTITFGGDADMDRMKKVAAKTGGRHYHADTGTQLSEVFREIAKTLPTQLTL